jgi:hypothetical protein
MENTVQESIKRIQAHLENEEFNEGLTILEELKSSPEIEDLQHQLEQARNNKIDTLLKRVDEAKNNEDWDLANSLIQEALALDGKDERIQAKIKLLTESSDTAKINEEITEKKQRAKSLIEKGEKTKDDLDTAIDILEKIILHSDDIETQQLLDKAINDRKEFLKSQGQVATLEQAEEHEEALRSVNDLIERGWREFEGRDIFKYRGELENRAKDFAEEKAGNYLTDAEKVWENDPKLALKYIMKGLELPYVPANRRRNLEDLKLKAEHSNEKYIEAEKKVQEALEHMYKTAGSSNS